MTGVSGTIGRYVRVQLNTGGVPLSLAEVEIFGRESVREQPQDGLIKLGGVYRNGSLWPKPHYARKITDGLHHLDSDERDWRNRKILASNKSATDSWEFKPASAHLIGKSMRCGDIVYLHANLIANGERYVSVSNTNSLGYKPTPDVRWKVVCDSSEGHIPPGAWVRFQSTHNGRYLSHNGDKNAQYNSVITRANKTDPHTAWRID